MKPLISVVLPTYNEAAHIEGTLRSLLEQKREDFELEILVIDGESEDDTSDLASRFIAENRVRLLRNPSRTAPSAFNLGLRAAAGEYVCILGAHASYPPNYIETCYRELLSHNATGCSGCIVTVPAKQTRGARLAAWCLGHVFASSPNSVRTQAGGFTETIPYPLFRKAALLELGGYDERLRRNQDNDMNHRLRSAGHRLYLTPETEAKYLARADVKALWAYGYLSGQWNAFTLRVNAACMRLRHFAPFAFGTSVIALASVALFVALVGGAVRIPLIFLSIVLGSHLFFGLVAAVHVGVRERSAAASLLPLVILGFHLAYGMGTLAGFLTMFRGASPAANTTRECVTRQDTPLNHGTGTTAH